MRSRSREASDIQEPLIAEPAMDSAHKPPSNLGDVLSRTVLRVGEDAYVVDALRVMAKNVVSSVVVMCEQNVLGIFTEGDAVRAAADGQLRPERRMRDFRLRQPLTLPEHTDLREAYHSMNEANACHIIVTGAAGAIAGIVSETDLLCHTHTDSLTPTQLVSQAMTRDVASLRPDDRVADALALMSRRGIGCVVVQEDTRPRGIITNRDMVRLLGSTDEVRNKPVGDVMSQPVRSVAPEASVRLAERTMLDSGVRRLAVTDRHGAIVGILTEHDVVKTLQGHYVEFLRQTIGEQSQRLRATSQHMRDRMVLDNILSYSTELAIVALDLEQRVVFVNPLARELLGWPSGELSGQRALDIAGGTNLSLAVFTDSIPALRDGPLHQIVVNTIQGDRWIRARTFGIRDPQSKLAGYLLFAVDVTEAQQAQAALQESEERFRATFEQAAVGMCHADLDGRLLRVNRRFCDIAGYPAASLLGRNFREFSFAEDLPREERLIERVRSGDISTYCLEKRYISKDGAMVWANVTVSLIFDADGRPKHFLGVIEDISQRKAAEAALMSSEERLRRITNSMRDMVCQTDAQGRFLYATPSYLQILGYDPASLIGRSVFEFLHPEDKDSVIRAFQAALANKSPGKAEFRYRHANGDYLWIETTGDVLLDGSDKVVGAVFASRDSTQRKTSEVEAREFNAMLEQRVAERTAELAAANRELESFSYSVSHDLSAPLRAIEGFSTLLKTEFEPKLDAQGREYLQRIRGAARRMAQLIDDLLDLSRVSRRELRRQSVDLSELARGLIEELRWREPSRNIEWMVADGLVAEADPTLMLAVLQNLLGNAWKFTRPQAQARIEFGLEEDGGMPAFFVRDNGAGFDMEYSHKLFTPFQRLHGPAEFEGNGIGLATARQIIHRHGGKIWAEGAVDAGAVFRFTLGA